MIKTTIRKSCLWCSNNQLGEIKLCTANNCAFYSLRMGKNLNNISRLKAIRNKCLDCMGGSKIDVTNCEHQNCPSYPYRNGKNPARRGIGNKDIKNYANFKNTSLSNVKINKKSTSTGLNK